MDDPFGELDLDETSVPYPGDDAPKAQIARWMAVGARRAGLPPELPVMAALVESGLSNLRLGDADSIGYFQIPARIWDGGRYAGFPTRADLQLQWFIDIAGRVRDVRAKTIPSFGRSSADYGEWIADVERPAAQFRGRYQEHLDEARALIAGA